MSYVTKTEDEINFCRELGLHPNRVRSISIEMRPHDVLTAMVAVVVPAEVAKRLFNYEDVGYTPTAEQDAAYEAWLKAQAATLDPLPAEDADTDGQ